LLDKDIEAAERLQPRLERRGASPARRDIRGMRRRFGKRIVEPCRPASREGLRVAGLPPNASAACKGQDDGAYWAGIGAASTPWSSTVSSP